MAEQPPDKHNADFKFPPEESSENTEAKQFEALSPPEVRKGWSEIKKETGNSQPMRHEITDAEGRRIFIRETSYQDGNDPSPETRKSDWQQFTDKYDNQGRALEVRSQKLMPGQENTTYLQHEYNDQSGTQTTMGKIEAGLDAGHEWKTSREIVKDFGDGRVIKRETTEVMQQGQNPNKPALGSKFTKTMYLENGGWLGEEVLHPDGKITVQLKNKIDKLPNWK